MLILLAFAHLNAYAESGSDDESKTQGLSKESQSPSPTSSAFLSRTTLISASALTTARSGDLNEISKTNPYQL